MMKGYGILGLGFGLLLACSSAGPGIVSQPGSVRGAGAPLRMDIEPMGGGWSIQVNDTVQVALFEIVPTRGVGLLHPRSAEESGWLLPGRHEVRERGGAINRHRAAYLTPQSGPLGGARPDAVQGVMNRVVVGVACDCVLDLSELAEPGGPRRLLGPFASVTEPGATSRILEVILPVPKIDHTVARWLR